MNATERTNILLAICRVQNELNALLDMITQAENEEAQMLDDMATEIEGEPLDETGELTDEQFAELLFKPRDYACIERMGW